MSKPSSSAEIGRKLISAGISAELVADVLDLPVMEVIDDSLDIISEKQLEEALPRAGLELVWMAIQEAEVILKRGAMAMRVNLIRALLTPVLRSAKYDKDNETSGSVLMEAIGRLLSSIEEDVSLDDEDEDD